MVKQLQPELHAQLPNPHNFPQAHIRIGVFARSDVGGDVNSATASIPAESPPLVAPYQLTVQFDTVWIIAQRWETFGGPLQMAIAAPPPYPASIVQTQASVSTRVVAWSAARVGAWPFCPTWDTKDPNEYLRYKSIVPIVPAIGPDSTKFYRVQGIYAYYLKNQISDRAIFPAGAYPFDARGASNPGLAQTQFQSLLGKLSG